MKQSLLGYLAHNFASSEERLATSALHFILEGSEVCRQELGNIVSQCGVSVDGAIRYSAEVGGSEGDRPDLVGTDRLGSERIILEAKFWAGLTDAQPVQYLRRILRGRTGALLVIAPALRFATLEPELLRRCREAGILQQGVEFTPIGGELRTLTVNPEHVLGIISWKGFLSNLAERCRIVGEVQTTANIEQLLGLCERMDSDAFLPLSGKELASSSGRRLIQFSDLVQKAVALAIQRNVAQPAKGRNFGWYGAAIYWAPMSVGSLVAYLCVNAELWSRCRETPLWYRIYAAERGEVARDLENALVHEHIKRGLSVVRDTDQNIWMPIYLPTGAEEATVVRSIVEQINAWSDGLPGSAGATT